jgi:lysophospholipase L1-like esterase
LGNSITYSGQYVAYIDAYLTLKYPGKQYECINLGLPSETVSGLSEPGHGGGRFPRPDLRERLERVLTQTQPNLVIACYGMNDGIYMPFDDERFKAFREGIGWLHEQVTKAEVSLLYATPPVYDERKGKAYANVLDIYSDWLISLRYTQNRRVVDIHWPMKKYQEDRRQADSLFAYAADGIHPNETGHFVMAKQILLSLGESELTGAKTIQEALAPYAHADMVLKLVEKRQAILKDAWLTHTGHKRPGMSKGLPLQEATEQAAAIDRQIRALVRKPKAM